MFALRQYHSLNKEEESVYGKNVVCASNHSTAIVTCCGHSSTVTPSLTSTRPSISTTTSTAHSSTGSTSLHGSARPSSSVSSVSSSSKSSSSSPLSPSLTLQSIKAAWKTLTTLGFGTTRLPHLERSESAGNDPHQYDYRYTQFPSAATNQSCSKKSKDSLHNTHLHIVPSRSNGSRGTSSQHSSDHLNLAKCLRKHREKQHFRALSRKCKSDNALQKIGVNTKSYSDQNLHKVCLIGGNSNRPSNSNSIFSNVQLSGGSGDSCGNSGTSGRYNPAQIFRYSRFPQRSRSLERNHSHRIQWHPKTTPEIDRHTRSLERNHKFHVDLRNLSSSSRDHPPSHPAPPPPIQGSLPFHNCDAVENSGGSISICSRSSSNSSSSACSSAGLFSRQQNMDGNTVGTSFINKPPRGWLHADQQLAEEGVCYGVRYIGALEVNTSMKSLNFDTRSLIAKECISKVCEAAGLKTVDRKRKVVKSIGRILGEKPLMEHAGSNITLTITSTALTLATLESSEVVARHEMPHISFASGGDPDTLDFIAYVAKDNRFGRACFVVECGGGLAQDVITTIGQAFELRFKEYLKRTPTPVQYTNVKPDNRPNGESIMWNNRSDRDYYNDLPGKVPPDLQAPPIPPLPQVNNSMRIQSQSSTETPHVHGSTFSTASHGTANSGNENLIDFTAEGVPLRREPEYVNDNVIKLKQSNDVKDPFDMQPFSMQLTQLGGPNSNTGSGTAAPKTLPLPQRIELQKEPWFHGSISRKEAEHLLKQDGDFLVRESQGTAGQYVLTGIQNNLKKHLLLVDPEGVVRTKSRSFDSVSHLINFHRQNELPIVSSESALLLRNPVNRARS